MPKDYLTAFPIHGHLVPARLRELLSPIGLDPTLRVEVSAMFETREQQGPVEAVHLQMAVVPEDEAEGLGVLDQAGEGVVAHSVPALGGKGQSMDFSPQLSGYDYVVASWGDGSSYTFSLAEKVWMALGLTPRCLGNGEQRLVYDDLGLPEFGIAEGEISMEYHWEAARNVSWRMSNEHLRRYLWMRGAVGVRAFCYGGPIADAPEARAMMKGQSHVSITPEGGWCEVDIQEGADGLYLQVWATVIAASCELCAEQSADGLVWPTLEGPMTRARADGILAGGGVHLDDRFLERYEQNAFYGSTPDRWGNTNPSYRGRWAFSDCTRVGSNLIQVPIRELYKPKPDREVIHAHSFVASEAQVAATDLGEEHIVGKVQRLVEQLLDLGDNLAKLAIALGMHNEAESLVGLSRVEIETNGWHRYSQLSRLARVAPLDMTQAAFLSRCKSLHELWQRIPNGVLRSMLRRAGCPANGINNLASGKLLQALLNIVEGLDAQQESIEAFSSENATEDWNRRNERLAALFLNNDLRIAEAHDTVGEALQTLQALGFDTASVNQGYGRALDFVLDAVVDAFAAINQPLRRVLDR